MCLSAVFSAQPLLDYWGGGGGYVDLYVCCARLLDGVMGERVVAV